METRALFKKLPQKTKLVGAAVIVVAVAVSFYGGMQLEKAEQHRKPIAAQQFDESAITPGGMMRRGGRMGSSLRVVGQVTAVSSSSITVNDARRGGATTLSITSNTKVTNNGATAAVSDIKTGDTVMIQKTGTTSTEASQITINPSFGGASTQAPDANVN
ncbi:MAG TPA: hypothetical protein VLF60_00690 [Candidatus Saccharimonadales bacterium]|nr:hypothetical protein [Candidatus Saccharimonadales bacterium]